MDRRPSSEGILEVREVDPDDNLALSRRTGSLRTAARTQSLGIQAEADGAFGFYTQFLDNTNGITIGLSARTYALEADGETETLFHVAPESSASYGIFVEWVRVSAASYSLRIRNTNFSAVSVTDDITGLMPGTHHIALRIPSAAVGSATVYTGLSTASVTCDQAGTAGMLYLLGNPDKPAKASSARSVLSNLAIYDTALADPTTLFGDRSPAAANLVAHFLLDGKDGIIEAPSSGTGYFALCRCAPSVVDGATQFIRWSGALRIDQNIELEQFWSTRLNAAGQTDFALHIKGRYDDGFPGRDQYLIDYGDMLKVWVDSATDRLWMEYNGQQLGSNPGFPLTAGTNFEAFIGRDDSNLYVITDGNTATASVAVERPFLDFSDVPDFIIGTIANPTNTHEGFAGALETVALWNRWVSDDVGAERAIFYLDLTDSFLDLSPNKLSAAADRLAWTGGLSFWAPGPIQDATYVGVEAGVALAESGAEAARIFRALGSDLTGERVGFRSFVASGGTAHLIDNEAGRMRSMGIEQPSVRPSLQTIGPGVLDGVVGYGIRLISVDGTHGPVRRLDPLDATGGQKVLIGSSGGSLLSELGESYIELPFSTAASAQWQKATSLGNGAFVHEVYAQLPTVDDDTTEELVFDRGLKNGSGSAVMGARADSRATSLDPGATDW